MIADDGGGGGTDITATVAVGSGAESVESRRTAHSAAAVSFEGSRGFVVCIGSHHNC